MAAPFIGLGLKAANSLIDKHFHKIPDKYMHSDAYAPKNLPNPLKKKKKRRDLQDQAQDSDGSRPASPSPPYDVEDADNMPIQPDIPRYSGAGPDDFINPLGRMPQQYSTAPPHIRPEYVPPPPIGMVYPSPPPPQPNNQFPSQPKYNQFPPPRNKYSPPSLSSDQSRDGRCHKEREQRRGDRDGRRDRSSDEDRRGHRPKNNRRSSSHGPPYEKHATRYKSHENGEGSQTEEYYRSARRPKNSTRRSSSHQPSWSQELSRYTTSNEDRSDFDSHITKTLNPYDEEYEIYYPRASRRPILSSRRNRSYHERDSDNYYPPPTRDNGRRRRDSVSSSSKRYSDFDDSRARTSDDAQLFTKSKEGLLSGALGAVVGGWAAQTVQRSASGRDGKRPNRSSRGRDQEDDKILTLLGAAVGGLAANAVVEHMEESKIKKERVENVRPWQAS